MDTADMMHSGGKPHIRWEIYKLGRTDTITQAACQPGLALRSITTVLAMPTLVQYYVLASAARVDYVHIEGQPLFRCYQHKQHLDKLAKRLIQVIGHCRASYSTATVATQGKVGRFQRESMSS